MKQDPEEFKKNKYDFDQIEPAPGPRKAVKDGLPVGTMRFDYVSPPEYCECEQPEEEKAFYKPYGVWYSVCRTCGNEIRK